MAEYKRVWLPYSKEQDTSKSSETVIVTCYPIDDDKTKMADGEIKKLVTQGWKIVSTTPVTGSVNYLNPNGGDVYHTFTGGIEVFMVKE